eukprot:jgi/Chlat1/8522/Chrsp80S00642
MGNLRQRKAKRKWREGQPKPGNAQTKPEKDKEGSQSLQARKEIKKQKKPLIGRKTQAVVKYAARSQQQGAYNKNILCFKCREYGHSLVKCPQLRASKEEVTRQTRLCYNCGALNHALRDCPDPIVEGGTKYATCFVCNSQGHLSARCPKSQHGIYPKGGSCKVCGQVTHLAKDCPSKQQQQRMNTNGRAPSRAASMAAPQGKRTVFSSGDDLNDDFAQAPEQVDAPASEPKSTTQSKEPTAKRTKVVQF